LIARNLDGFARFFDFEIPCVLRTFPARAKKFPAPAGQDVGVGVCNALQLQPELTPGSAETAGNL
jgi:hypothetical protein